MAFCSSRSAKRVPVGPGPVPSPRERSGAYRHAAPCRARSGPGRMDGSWMAPGLIVRWRFSGDGSVRRLSCQRSETCPDRSFDQDHAEILDPKARTVVPGTLDDRLDDGRVRSGYCVTRQSIRPAGPLCIRVASDAVTVPSVGMPISCRSASCRSATLIFAPCSRLRSLECVGSPCSVLHPRRVVWCWCRAAAEVQIWAARPVVHWAWGEWSMQSSTTQSTSSPTDSLQRPGWVRRPASWWRTWMRSRREGLRCLLRLPGRASRS